MDEVERLDEVLETAQRGETVAPPTLLIPFLKAAIEAQAAISPLLTVDERHSHLGRIREESR